MTTSRVPTLGSLIARKLINATIPLNKLTQGARDIIENEKWLRSRTRYFYIPIDYFPFSEQEVEAIMDKINDYLLDFADRRQKLISANPNVAVFTCNTDSIHTWVPEYMYADTLEKERLLRGINLNSPIPQNYQFCSLGQTRDAIFISEMVDQSDARTNDDPDFLSKIIFPMLEPLGIKRGDIVYFEHLDTREEDLEVKWYIVDKKNDDLVLKFFYDDDGITKPTANFLAITEYPPGYFHSFEPIRYIDKDLFAEEMFNNLRFEDDTLVTTIDYPSAGHGNIHYTIFINPKKEDNKMPSSVEELGIDYLDNLELFSEPSFSENNEKIISYFKRFPYTTLVYEVSSTIG